MENYAALQILVCLLLVPFLKVKNLMFEKKFLFQDREDKDLIK